MDKKESKSLSSPIKLLQKSWKDYKANAKTFTLILIFPAILELILRYITIPVLKPETVNNMSSITPFLPIILIGLLLVYIPILFWSNTTLYLCIVEKSSDWRRSYRKALNKIIPFFLINLLTVLLVLGGLVLFIIPGIILSVWLGLAPFVYFEQNKEGFNALAKSKEYIKGYWWSVFLRSLFILLVSLMVTILFGLITEVLRIPNSQSIIAIALTPITILYNFELYRELKAIHSKD